MKKLQKANGYIKCRTSGKVIPIMGEGSIEIIELGNQKLIKENKEHLIKFDVLYSKEIEKLEKQGKIEGFESTQKQKS